MTSSTRLAWLRRLPWTALIVLFVTFAVPVYTIAAYPGALLQVGAGALASIPTSFVVAWLLLKLQEPRLVVTPEAAATVGNRDTYWLHARVDNVALGLMGGGRAHEVSADLLYEEGGTVRRFHLKWSSKREPVATGLVPTPSGPQVGVGADPALFEQAKLEEIRPGGSRDLGIGFKKQGDPNFYVFEPESYTLPLDWRLPNNRFGPGTHRFRLVVLYDGRQTKPLELEVTNLDSPEKSSVRLAVATG